MIICTLKKLMEENDKTQSEVATTTGITRPTLLSLIRNDNQSIRYETINQLCKYFNIDMSELLVYSPVEMKLKKVLIESVPISLKYELTEENSSFSISLIYEIDGIEFEFDTNLNVTETDNTLKNSSRFFLHSVVYEDVLNTLEVKGFKKEFILTYNDSIDIEDVIKKELKNSNLDTNFYIKSTDLEFQQLEKDNKAFDDLVEELKSLVDSIPFNDDEKEMMFKKINDIKHTNTNNDGD
ncbi:helix-turn-helix transcriptional regulator [Staphylococcus saprophyticus]|uniref:helix-turn-helix domain-containing protein n=1 Tax=Staphylococcus saprophyticus TaxID=29385 RepID=UPI00188985A9|nr:helix-turn-helix transcriptional regulator [Staphylococcus saprophyticus]MBF2780111.1 helix-turn-helix transcriptional regulator [Staphylococcus saprophyticus]MDW4357195.1 helix-turn-helix transcriptional regulator [Staphylococcus saprophyticus]MEB7677514.1 helix-turn-helix transcriptional regulator [Staphylococcus saprophyticus]